MRGLESADGNMDMGDQGNMGDQGDMITMPFINVAGEMSDVDVNDVDANKVLDYIISQMNKDTTITNEYIVDKVKVNSIQEQVVAGTKYDFSFDIANTVCRLKMALNGCPLMTENNNHRLCSASVVQQGDEYSDLNFVCAIYDHEHVMGSTTPHIKTLPPIIVGGMNHVDVNDVEANRVLGDVIKQINMDKHWSYFYAKRSVLSISLQEVAGTKYEFSFIISVTNCTADNNCGHCEFKKGKKAKSRHCTASVVSQSWMPADSQYSHLTYDCNMCKY